MEELRSVQESRDLTPISSIQTLVFVSIVLEWGGVPGSVFLGT
jgi:hypothetical protein